MRMRIDSGKAMGVIYWWIYVILYFVNVTTNCVVSLDVDEPHSIDNVLDEELESSTTYNQREHFQNSRYQNRYSQSFWYISLYKFYHAFWVEFGSRYECHSFMISKQWNFANKTL